MCWLATRVEPEAVQGQLRSRPTGPGPDTLDGPCKSLQQTHRAAAATQPKLHIHHSHAAGRCAARGQCSSRVPHQTAASRRTKRPPCGLCGSTRWHADHGPAQARHDASAMSETGPSMLSSVPTKLAVCTRALSSIYHSLDHAVSGRRDGDVGGDAALLRARETEARASGRRAHARPRRGQCVQFRSNNLLEPSRVARRS